jgi:FMN phosphatase YigB (HAD superfamily)
MYNRVMRNKETRMINKTKTKAFVFDFDETLAHTSAVELDGTEDRFAEFNDPSDGLGEGRLQ